MATSIESLLKYTVREIRCSYHVQLCTMLRIYVSMYHALYSTSILQVYDAPMLVRMYLCIEAYYSLVVSHRWQNMSMQHELLQGLY